MIRYRLDDLGWYQFEWLIQSLLKAECGLVVESWGGSGDYGKDAYSKESLFLLKKKKTKGPFIFQAKFVQNANAAGANYEKMITSATEKEIERIKKRIVSKHWTKPNYYVLITNAPLSASERKNIVSKIASEKIANNILVLGAYDVCDLLDQHETLRRSFPQLLSIRDLDHLINQAVNKEVRTRSAIALSAAKDVVDVFVPTKAYAKAWQVLNKYNFVVLEGPPEVGKTAIAWMIGLSKLSEGWASLVCDSPDDFYKQYSADENQIFIADDAFGRTEYDPARGKEWERNFERIVNKLDNSHWLIWTSRKYILERAVKAMDLQGKTRKLPDANAVLVDASSLSIREKALILYRHARSVNLEEKSRLLLRDKASLIVKDSSFTPERIRRFVIEVLPELADLSSGNMSLIEDEIRKAIQTPTDRMRKTFNALNEGHKAILMLLLEADYFTNVKSIKERYEQNFQEHVQVSQGFEDLIDELSESFIKIS